MRLTFNKRVYRENCTDFQPKTDSVNCLTVNSRRGKWRLNIISKSNFKQNFKDIYKLVVEDKSEIKQGSFT
ncbi:hypothetical protein OA81_09170 [Clostridium butyricum]|nr:hypothetical protein OA81_09170 [Clostridium butyricum]